MKLTSNRSRLAPKPAHSQEGQKINPRLMPWYKLFVDYGFADAAIPVNDPPRNLNSYGAIITWVSQDNWIIEQDENLAIDIWLKKVSLTDYKPRSETSQAPLQSQPQPEGQPKIIKKPLSRRNRQKPKSAPPPAPSM